MRLIASDRVRAWSRKIPRTADVTVFAPFSSLQYGTHLFPMAEPTVLVILGIVGEYLGRLYLTANGKPQSVIREVRRSQFSRPAEPHPPVWLRETAGR